MVDVFKGLNMNEKDFALLKKMIIYDEGIRLKPYKCSAGKTTIGIGRNLEDVGISESEAHLMCENDIIRFSTYLFKTYQIMDQLSPVRQFALINMCYNLGERGISKFKAMWEALKNKDFDTASAEMLNSLWAVQVKQRATRLAHIIKYDEVPVGAYESHIIKG